MEPDTKVPTAKNSAHTGAELIAYRSYVELMFEQRSDVMISIKNTDHAKILIETLISRSKKSLNIFCHNLCDQVYGTWEMGARLASAANRGVKVRVLIQIEPEACDLEAIVSVLANPSSSVEFRTARKRSSAELAKYNFVVVDNISFRFETDWSKPVASACANNENLATRIAEKFEELWLAYNDQIAD
jgi:hypothetical protein